MAGLTTSKDHSTRADFRFTRTIYTDLCDSRSLDEFKRAIPDRNRSRFGPTTFCPPPSCKLPYGGHWTWRPPDYVPSPLVTAAWFGRRAIFQYLAETFPIDINADGRVYTYISTPLVAACHLAQRMHLQSDCSFVKYLVDKGANVNRATLKGETPLMAAVTCSGKGSNLVVQYLLDIGANVNSVDSNGENCLFAAAVNYAHEHFAKLVSAGVDLCHRNAQGYTVVHKVCVSLYEMDKLMRVLKALVKSGCPPLHAPSTHSSQPGYVACPLYLAAASGKKETVEWLIEQGNCPHECIADAYLLLSVEEVILNRFDIVYRYLSKGLAILQKHKIALSYPPPRPEFNGHVEIRTKEELDTIWDNGECRRESLVFQCALIAERCLGPSSLLYADILLKLEVKLVLPLSLPDFNVGEKILELRAKTLVSFYDRICSQTVHCSSEYLLNRASEHTSSITTAVRTMIRHKHIPDFSRYIQFELRLLAYFPPSLKDASYHINKYDYCSIVEHIMEQFLMMWRVAKDTEHGRSEFLTLLKPFVEQHHNYCKGCTLLFVALDNCKETQVFLEVILEAGGDRDINVINDRGERPLHVVQPNKALTKLLIDHGAHIDAVNSRGKTAFRIDLDTFGVPSLYCTVANAIVQYSLPYQSIGLPPHVVQFVMLHDQESYLESI